MHFWLEDYDKIRGVASWLTTITAVTISNTALIKVSGPILPPLSHFYLLPNPLPLRKLRGV